MSRKPYGWSRMRSAYVSKLLFPGTGPRGPDDWDRYDALVGIVKDEDVLAWLVAQSDDFLLTIRCVGPKALLWIHAHRAPENAPSVLSEIAAVANMIAGLALEQESLRRRLAEITPRLAAARQLRRLLEREVAA